ncbi:high mobility group B protein 7-like, partial [Trifolium medium]|nr:high mobility group B protein 7-like [Trifolium medium]
VGKEAGEKWRSLTDEEKKPYLDRVIELKAEYEKAMEIYNATKKDDQEEGSDKSDKEAPAVEEVEELTDEE